jgi:hypothetical protein
MAKTTNNQQFIKISNQFFYTLKGETSIWFHQIGTIGFALYCYFLIEQEKRKFVLTDVQQILLETSLSSKNTIIKYIKLLHNKKIIKLERPYVKTKKDKNNNEILQEIGLHEKIRITCNKQFSNIDSNFTIMSCDLYRNKIKIIGHIGWSVLCLFTKLFNYNYSDSPNNIGYCNPSIEHISKVLGVSENPVSESIRKLEDISLIKIYSQKKKEYTDKNNKLKYYSYNNQYLVYNKVPGNTYYIDNISSLKEADSAFSG